MYNPTVRIIIAIAAVLLAFKFYLTGNMTSMYMVIAALALNLWSYFKNGTVFLAFQQLKKENYQKAENLLSKIKNPDYLKKSQKSYYHFTKGFIELNKQNLDEGFNQLTTALKMGLRTENDTSIATLNLAAIELERKNFEQARNYLQTAKKLKHKQELQPEIRRIEKELNALNFPA